MAKRKGSIGAVSKVDTKKLKEAANCNAKTKETKCKKETGTVMGVLNESMNVSAYCNIWIS